MKFNLDSPLGVASSMTFISGIWMVSKTNSLSALIYPLLMGVLVGGFSFLLHESLRIDRRIVQSSLRLKFFQGLMVMGFSLLVIAPYMIEEGLSSSNLTWQDVIAQGSGYLALNLGMIASTFFVLMERCVRYSRSASFSQRPVASISQYPVASIFQGPVELIAQRPAGSIVQPPMESISQGPVAPILQEAFASGTEPKSEVFFPSIVSSPKKAPALITNAKSQSQDSMDGVSDLCSASPYSVLSF